MNRVLHCIAIAAIAATLAQGAAAAALEIYFIDVEGGQATLLVTPAGESLLIDTGFPGTGTFQSAPGDPRVARDAQRIAAAARDAGLARIDYLLITHFHADHVGGVVELAQLLPIRTFVDHGGITPEVAAPVRGTLEAFNAYAAARATAERHLEPKPGERLPLEGIEAIVVSSAGLTIGAPLAGAGEKNALCAPVPPDRWGDENSRSTGLRLTFGEFRFLDLGDLGGKPLFDLACPNDLIGAVDVYLVAHHGGADAAEPATFAAFKPRVAILNNGARKGGSPEIFAVLRQVPGLEDVWQLHRSELEGAENFAAETIANLDETTAHWLKVSANDDGSFRVLNGRTGVWQDYPPASRHIDRARQE